MTVEPQLLVDPSTGEQYLDYNHANVIDHNTRIAAIEEVNRQQKYAITEDHEGNKSHAWDVDNPEAYDADSNVLTDYDPSDDLEYTADDFSSMEELTSYLLDECGDEYQHLLNWASNTLDEEDIELYDQLIESGDVAAVIDAVKQLTLLYNNYHE